MAWVAPVARPGATGGCAQAAGAHHVALVVEHGNGTVLTRCVGFDGTGLSGEQVLQMGGVEFQTSQYGGSLGRAVCRIDAEPATYPPGCFSATSPYWVLFVARAGGAWSVSNLGASGLTLRDGDAEGWRYDPQAGSPAQPPSPAGVCEAVAIPAPSAPVPVPPPSPTPALATPIPASSAATSAEPAQGLAASPSAQPSASPSAAAAAPPPGPDRGSAAAAPASAPWGMAAAAAAGVALIAVLLIQALPRLRP